MNLRDRAMSFMLSSGGSAKFDDDREPRHLLFALIKTLLENDWHIPTDTPARVRGEGSSPVATYTMLGSLYEHECQYGCDSKWAVNCNCQGKCEKHPPVLKKHGHRYDLTGKCRIEGCESVLALR